MFEIEKGIEMPNKKSIYPFMTMEKGDSFFVPLDGDDRQTIRNRLGAAATYAASRKSVKFSIRFNKEREGYRCWRIELDAPEI